MDFPPPPPLPELPPDAEEVEQLLGPSELRLRRIPLPSLWYAGSSLRREDSAAATAGVVATLLLLSRLRSLDLLRLRSNLAADWRRVDSRRSTGLPCFAGEGDDEDDVLGASLKRKKEKIGVKTREIPKQNEYICTLSEWISP